MINVETALPGGMAVIAGRTGETVTGHAAVNPIGGRIRVTRETTEDLAVIRNSVALNTITPLARVGTGEDREELGVMLCELSSLTGWVTEVAVLTVVDVSSHVAVKGIHIRLIVLMTRETIDYCSISGGRVAGTALSPLSLMGSGENWKVLPVMFNELPTLSGRVTQITILAAVRVSRHSAVDSVHCRLAVGMARSTVYLTALLRVGVAR
jgi:hypothetical protein